MAEKEEKKVGFAEEAAPGPKDRNRAVGAVQAHLAEQNLETLDVAKLSPLTPEVISRQATINIGARGRAARAAAERP